MEDKRYQAPTEGPNGVDRWSSNGYGLKVNGKEVSPIEEDEEIVNKMENKELIRLALEARKMSYSPYSGFMVGAALLAKNGKVYQGCNIENSAYTPTNCAERTAFFKAISEGVKDFEKIVVVGGPKDEEKLEFCAPCGVCRQVMTEFCNYESFEIILAKNEEEYKVFTLKQLLPEAFGPEDLG